MNDIAEATRVLYDSTVTGVGGQVEEFDLELLYNIAPLESDH